MADVEVKSPLLEKKEEIVERPDYSPEEELYLKGLRTRMENARNARDTQHDEFDGMDYVTYYDLNERLANTFVTPKKNKEDTNFQSGLIRQKLFALLSSLVNLNLAGDISAFDKDGLIVQGLGDAIEDVILKTNELDGDKEKKFLRQYELLKHGTVFIEELWDERQKKSKKLSKKFTGKIKGVDWTTKLKKAFARPSRNLIPGTNVYLGDITKYDISEQPFVFTADVKPYEEVKMIFGDWDWWENVPKKLAEFNPGQSSLFSSMNWRLLETRDNYVEILRYQDKWNNEFALVLNGVLMTPVGLPLPWGWEDYNIVQQNLEPIHSKFAYGKSLVFRTRNKVALLDELLRLAILKTQKSFLPPYINISGRVLSNKVLMPGKISHGIPPNTLIPINDKETQGVTAAEFGMIKELQDSINTETVSPTFQGQQAQGNPTATEIIELQRQAKQMLGLTIFSVSMLEWKLEWLRLLNILQNWFSEEDKVVDEARGVLKSQFRTVSVERPIEGEGMGRRITVPTTEIPGPQTVKKVEDMLTEEQGAPVRLIFLNPEQLKKAKLMWQIVVRPKEERSSEVEKLMFRAFMQDIQAFGPTINLQYLQEKFASIWQEDPKKLFMAEQQMMGMQPEGQGTPQKTLSPSVNLPSPETALRQRVKTQVQ